MVENDKLLTYLKRVSAELYETRERLRKVEAGEQEPIAIVGMSCRLPGGVDSPESLWDLLADGTDATSGLPTDRGWESGIELDQDSTMCRGGFLHDAGEFDPGFFGISPREALATDPQQRLLLETSWEALERAGIDPRSLRESPTGVFAGANPSGYPAGAAAGSELYQLTGTAVSVVSGRISYTLGLEGPAVTVDTACSSSLVALHLAAQALRSGECSLALAGGVTVMAVPVAFSEASRKEGLAADGRCKAFGATGDGLGWAEGAAVLALERLSDARRNGHPVLALLRGSAVNQDGASNGLTAPNGPSQQRVIRAALASARLSAADVDAVEAHGTGTTLGDPIEAQALFATYGQDRPEGRPLWLGSVKSNIGHTQSAAGAAGVMKMVLALRHQQLPRTLHADEPSPHIDWSSGAVRLLSEAKPWPSNGRPRRAAVSSFGISGTNAHVILEEAPATGPDTPDTPAPGNTDNTAPDERAPVLGRAGRERAWLVSGRSREALRSQAARLVAHVDGLEDLDPGDLGWALATTRSAFEHRAVVLGADRGELSARLSAVAEGQAPAGVVTGVAGEAGPVVFVFPGQGSQWVGMGRELAASSPVFAARLAECGRALAPFVDWSLDEVLAGGEGAPGFDRVDVVQPALWAVMVSLAEVWRAAGVRPGAVVGHSQGEIAAAVVAGMLSLEDAARVVALRSRALLALSGRGGMLSVGEPVEVATGRIVPWQGRVSVAAVNGPDATVLSGDVEALDEIEAACERAGVRTRLLPVDYASHGAQVEALRDEILAALDGINPQPGSVPLVSALTGEVLKAGGAGPEYWYASLRGTVRFSRAVDTLRHDGHSVFIEVSPHPVLTAAISATLEQRADAEAEPTAADPELTTVVAGTLRRDDGGPGRVLASLAEVHVRGVPVDWRAVLTPGQPVDLPTYAFQRQRYWVEKAAGGADVASAGLGSVGHPLLGAVIELADGDAFVFTGRLSPRSQPWLADHQLDGVILFPGTGFAELALVAGARVECTRIDELTMAAPLVLSATDTVQIQVTVSAPDSGGQRDVEIFARPTDAGIRWTRHAAGRLAPARPPVEFADGELTVWPPAGAVAVALAVDVAVDGGGRDLEGPNGSGPTPRAVWRRGGDVFAEVVLPEGLGGDAGDFGLHPVLLNAALQAVALAGPVAGADGARMPFAWNGMSLYAVGASVLRARLRQSPTGALAVLAADATGAPVVSVESLVLRPVAASVVAAGSAPRDALFGIDWVPVPVSVPAPGGHWAVLGPGGLGLIEPLAAVGVEVRAHADLAALTAVIESGGPAPAVVLAGIGTAAYDQEDADEGAFARRVTGEALELAQRWLALDLPARLVVLTRAAVATGPGEGVADLGAAAALGLLRSAQSEHPGRLVLVDLAAQRDTGAAAEQADVLVAALGTGEPEIAVRGNRALGRRLARPSAAATPSAAPGETARGARTPGAVLVTGGTGTLAGLTARHLAVTGRAARLILLSRSGPGAAGAAALAAEIAASGVAATVVACDVGERAALTGLLTGLLAGLPADVAVTGVVHTAGVVDDGVIGSLTPERVDAVMRPKADAAWALHELTLGLDLDLFVLFSSAAAVFGGAGQGNYAAGNAFLDALADRRRAAGLTAVSLAWGAWMASAGIGRNLSKGLLNRATGGVGELSADEGLTLLDLALTRDEAVLMPVRFDVAGMRAQAERGAEIPALLRGLAGPARLSAASAANQGAGADTLRRQLAGASAAERDRVLTELVRTHAAAVLGHTSADAIEPGRAFTDLGFDSLTAVELRNRLSATTGLRLPATLVFDYPMATVLAGHLASELLGLRSPDTTAPARTAPIEPGEPVAIVGMGCRFPGGVRDPESFWELLAGGGDAVSGLPLDRGWDIASLYDPDPDKTGTFYSRSGGFVHDAGQFDPGFFGISPREALAMDPQQRLLLEISWEALERAGIDPTSLRGSRTGVFVGGTTWGYGLFGSTGAEGHLLTGASTSVISGRVSYTLGLEGPAVTIDTACSSSLVALHLAAQALRAGECSLALAGGVTIMATPGVMVGISRQRGLAEDGRCKAFSASADGIGVAEGAGMILLERLPEARRNGHPVLAVLRGSAVNQDGASNGLTAPNGPSQQRVIRAALANARLSPGDVDAVEAHGTGTVLGDPIEAQALLATYGQDRPANQPVWLGSVKSNIGHTQTAAGVAGVMKMVLALRHQELPRSLYAEEPARNIDWAAGELELLAKPTPWPVNGRVRRAGVSSFGISGTNAHVIIEEAPASGETPATEGASGPAVPVLTGSATAWLVSARSGAALAAQAGRVGEYLEARPELGVADVAWSLVTSRSVFEHRAVVVGGDRSALLSGFSAVAAGRPAAGVATGVGPAGGAGRTVFVFPGQGTQWVGMGRELAASSPVFAARLAECQRALAPLVDWSLDDVLAGAEGAPGFDRVDVLQPTLWSVMVSLAAVWEAAGVRPDAVVGHSQGEIAAAVVAGILSLEDAARVVALRSRSLLGALAGRGGMVSVAEPVDAVTVRVTPWEGRLSVAALNAPSATVVSGDLEALAALLAECERDGVRARMLPINCATHGPQVDKLYAETLTLLDGVAPRPGRLAMMSTALGEFVEGPELDAGYWYTSMRESVQFSRAIEGLDRAGYGVFIEISTHPVLINAISDNLEAAGEPDRARRMPVVASTLRQDDGGPGRLLASLADVHVRGVAVDWSSVLPTGRRVDLPTYAFQRQRYWLEAAAPAPQNGSPADARFWAAVQDGDLAGLADTLAVDADRSFREVLPALASWRQRQRGEAVTAGWRYQLSWLPLPLPGPRPTPLTGTWLLVAAPTQRELADTCAGALGAAGAEVVRIEVAPGETDRQALAARLEPNPAVAGVVSLLAMDETPLPGAPAVTAGLAATLALLQALGDREAEAPLWVLTRGAVATEPGEKVTAPWQAPVWGLGRVAGLEVPGRWGGLVDLPAELDEQATDRLVQVLAAGNGTEHSGTEHGGTEDQVAIRGAGVRGCRLVRAARTAGADRWTPTGTVLVTGGTGAIGGRVGGWLAGRGASRIVLSSRSGPGATGSATLAARLAETGSAVAVVACDVAQREPTAGLLGWFDRSGPALTAVFHVAGTGQLTPLDDLTVEGLAQVAAPKVAGAVNLDELTADRKLDAFVTFSSGAAIWGSGVQAGYAAANAFLDGLAEHRRGRGLAAMSVSWGLWGGGGMAEGFGDRLQRLGLREMDPDLAIETLAGIVDSSVGSPGKTGTVTVADLDWARFAPVFTLYRASALIGDLPEVRQALSANASGADDQDDQLGDGTALAERLHGLSRAERERLLTDLVRAEAAAVLGHASVHEVEADRAFKDLGLDSLTAVELRNRLNTATGMRLPATLLFDYPTPGILAGHLRAAMSPDEGTDSPSLMSEIERLQSTLADVTSDFDMRDDVTKLLRGMLSNWIETHSSGEPASGDIEFQSATPDEVFSFLDQEIGLRRPTPPTN